MRLLFIGYAMPSDYCIKYKGSSIAGNKMQLGVLKGLRESLGNNIDVITVPAMAPYPQFKKIFITPKKVELVEGIDTHFIPFINIPFIKQIMQIFFAVIYASIWVIKYYRHKEKVVFCFNSYPNVALAARVLKKLFGCKIVCLFADPPIDVSSRQGIAKMAWNLFEKTAEKSIKQFGCIVVLNKLAALDYAPKVPYIVVDGGFGPDDYIAEASFGKEVQDKEEKIVMFAGALIGYNGVTILIEAFKLIDNPLYKLWIFGDGQLKQHVENESKKDPRIIYKGLVSNEVVMLHQKKVDVLANPRPTDSDVSKYTFPSKLIEYMLSGTPVITTRLNGITEDYHPYLYFFDEETPEAFAQKITEVLGLDEEERRKKGIAAMEYVIKNKNWDVQCRKIVEFIFEGGTH